MNARKTKYEREAALKLLDGISELFVANGRKIEHIDLKKARPDDDTLAGLLLGRSGTLRAPVIRTGKKLVVGFNSDLYSTVFGTSSKK